MKILVTGARGFIGRNLCVSLERTKKFTIIEYDLDSLGEILSRTIPTVDAIIHLAGANRPKDEQEYFINNVKLTDHICEILKSSNRNPPFIFSSSIQAAQNNPYGNSKRRAEKIVTSYGETMAAPVYIFRLPGVFGKWCKPNYNSVVATFCFNTARGIDINVSDPNKIIDLVYIDDVVSAFLDVLEGRIHAFKGQFYRASPIYRISIRCLVEKIQEFHNSQKNLILPDLADRFIRCLYATYLAYIPEREFSYSSDLQEDSRGGLAEFLKSPQFGQIFISRTLPGKIRGNHYHDTKVEKFAVLAGEGVIRLRHIQQKDIVEFQISGKEFRVINIPPGYTHNVENIGDRDLIVLFWANEIFNSKAPDTYPLMVEGEKQK